VSTTDAGHLSIGEVLAALRDEFPDITISKIRFLESQGLVDPERTPSGYRKFYAHDLARLRWILFQQRDNFLPLKVIKERLDALPPGEEARLLDPEPPGPVASAPEAEAGGEPPSAGPPETSAARRTPPRRTPSLFAVDLPLDPAGASADAEIPASGRARSDTSYSRDELAERAGLDRGAVGELESYGLLAPAREVGGEARYDEDALEVATIAAGFFRRGVEARHLRMYLTSAEREAVLFGQVLMPYVRQRNPESRERLQIELVELAGLGRRLRAVMLREAIRETLSE